VGKASHKRRSASLTRSSRTIGCPSGAGSNQLDMHRIARKPPTVQIRQSTSPKLDVFPHS
jgi:hypothetical protein